MKILSNADLNLNQLKNMVLDNVDADPSSGVIGQVIYNITENVIKYYDGEQWIVIGTGQDGYSPQIVYSTHTWTFSNLASVDNEISLICQGLTLSSIPFYKKTALVINSEYLTDNTETITWELNGITGEDYFNKSKPFVIIGGSEDANTAVNVRCSTKVEGDALLADISDITNPDADLEFFKIAFTEKNADGSYSINITSDLRGSAGKDGADGVSPTVDITKEETTTTITITDVNGEHTSTIEDGYSPQISILNNLLYWATDENLNIYFYTDDDDNTYNIDVTDINSIELICWWYYEDTCIINWETDVSSGSFHPESSGAHIIIDTSDASWFKATSNTAATGQITYKDANLQDYNLEISYKDESTGEIVSIITDNLKGSDGESAYQIWLDLGNIGTEQDFIDSLKSTVNITGGETDYGTISVDDNSEITLSSAAMLKKDNLILSSSTTPVNRVSGTGNSLVMVAASSGTASIDGTYGIVLGETFESGYLTSSGLGGILSGYTNLQGNASTTGTSCMALGRVCSGNLESGGVGSVAIGTVWNDSKNYLLSTGSGSIAAGYILTSAVSTGDDSIGSEILSSGSGSIAIGDITTRGIISSTGNGSISGGCISSTNVTISEQNYIQATGNASIAMGNFFKESDGGCEITVSGNASMALGQVTAANVNMSIDGSGSLVVGNIAQSGDINVSGNGSACFIGGNYSVTHNISVTGDGSLVVGNGNIVSSGDGSVVLCSGGTATASGVGSICICEGGYVKATGKGSIAIGQGSNLESSGTSSILVAQAFGYSTGSYSFAMGDSPEARADYSFAFGKNAIVTSQYQVAFGLNNDPQDDLLFMIGNGTNSKPNNIFAIRDDGALVIDGTVVDITKLSSTATTDTGWEDINCVALDTLVPTRARRRITNNMVHFNIEIRSDTFSDIENLCNIITNQVIRSDYDNYGIFNTSIVKLEYDSDDQYASILYDQHISGNMRVIWETRSFANGTNEDQYNYNFSYVIPVDLYHNMVYFAHMDSFASQLLLSAGDNANTTESLYTFSDLIIDIDIQGMLT